MHIGALAVAMLVVQGGRLLAQAPANAPLARAVTLAQGGDSVKARALVDSVLADTDPDAVPYADALYWRATLEAGAEQRRKDFQRVIVEYPFSSHTGSALFRLAQLDSAAGDRQSAERHLGRLVRDYPTSEFAARGAFELGNMLMADGEVRPACAAFDSALTREPSTNIETRNQIAYAKRPCEHLRSEPRDSIARPAADAVDSTARRSARDRSANPKQEQPPSRASKVTQGGTWSVQVAAFAARTDAMALAERLTTRGYETRVTREKPYRVRIGHYTTRAAATAVAERLKSEKTTSIVVEAERP